MNIENEITEIKGMLKQAIAGSKEILNVQEMSVYTGIPVATIYARIGDIPRSKQGKRIFFLKKDIDNWLMSNKRKSSAEIEIEASNYLLKRKRV